ncbi:tetratricopeptide repeat protein [Psychrobacter cibarius]|uniref:tetratricopeptide repeat protein n=1 Tax=Psychrobacter cibarius TaxID=282669 RepID=UPI0019187038|nr:tetratricopeptide repeat protein [Psychrobacter cibarius]
MLSLKQTVSARSAVITRSIKIKPANTMLAVSALAGMLSLSACQTAPTASTAMKTVPTQTLPSSQTAKAPIATVTQTPIVRTEDEDDYPIEPYNPSEPAESTNPLTQETPVFTPSSPVLTQPDSVIIIPSRDDYIISEPSAPSHNELLEQARKNSQQRTQQATTNNSNLPAFRNLMQAGISQLKAGKLTNAENSFTRAQRLAPKSSAVYFYLAQVALKKNQPRKSEAMARRGLSVSQDTSRRRALWQIILQSGQAQGNTRVISEAKQALR